MNPEIFREYDVRGLVGRDLDFGVVYNLGRAIGTFGATRGVRTMTLGRDCRLSSEEYARAMKGGLMAAGMRVIDVGLCATPMLYFSIRHYKTDGGVMVTGSHNPPEFNGFKICVGPDTIYGEDIQALRQIVERGVYAAGNGSSETGEVTGAYGDCLYKNVKLRRGLKVIVDGGNGMGGHFIVPILERFGCRITCLYCDMDGRFPNHFPDPTVPGNLKELIHRVLEEKADVGIAFDGDGDRIGVVTDRGEILWGDELLLLFSRFILKERPGATIIGEVKCSQRLYDDIEKHGGRSIMWKAGHSLIKGKMKQEKAVLAGEMSGHLFFADRYFGYDDALYAALRLLEILSGTEQTISGLLADVPKSYTTPEIRIDCPDALKFKATQAIKKYFQKDYKTIETDGVRIIFNDGWGLVRASNTQPVLVLRFEASTPETLQIERKMVEDVLNAILVKMGART
ncbi:MAG: phosphomannomutase/phosphoglucomutase [Deltaproteobacteria bacterium]|nr:phosphomannomutase/phosphoglucomutase [Deltaproteobacteria bacterium]